MKVMRCWSKNPTKSLTIAPLLCDKLSNLEEEWIELEDVWVDIVGAAVVLIKGLLKPHKNGFKLKDMERCRVRNWGTSEEWIELEQSDVIRGVSYSKSKLEISGGNVMGWQLTITPEWRLKNPMFSVSWAISTPSVGAGEPGLGGRAVMACAKGLRLSSDTTDLLMSRDPWKMHGTSTSTSDWSQRYTASNW